MPVITPGLYPLVVRPSVTVGVITPGTSPGQIGRPGPARAGLSRLRPTFRRTQSREVASTVISAGAAPWESLGGGSVVAATTASSWEAQVWLAPVQGSPWETAGLFSSVPTFGVRGQLGGRSPGQIGSPGPARAGLSRLRPQFRIADLTLRETPIPVLASSTSPWAAAGSLTRAGAAPWEAVTNQIAVSSVRTVAWESLVKLVAILTAPWESTSLVPPYTQLYASVAQSIAVRPLIIGHSEGQIGHPGPGPGGFSRFRQTFPIWGRTRDAGGPVAQVASTPWSSGGGTTQTMLMVYEALAGTRAILAAPWISGGTSVSADQVRWESIASLSRVAQIPWASIFGVQQGAASPYESIRRVMHQAAMLWEAQSTQTAVAQVLAAFWEAQQYGPTSSVSLWESLTPLNRTSPI